MAKPPYFPLYVKDFVADSKVEAMTTEEVGAYFLLLCKAWNEEPPGSIPDNDPVLARWARIEPCRWSLVRSSVLSPFTKCTVTGRLIQKRMRDEYNKLAARLKKQSEGGKKGAEIRHSRKESEDEDDDSRLPSRLPIVGLPTGLPSTRAFGFGSGFESGFGFEFQGKDEGAGEGKGKCAPDGPVSPDQWPQFLTREWIFYHRSTAPSQKDPAMLDPFFESLIRQIPPQQVLARIRDIKSRCDREPTWEFEKFWAKPKGIHANGKERPNRRNEARYREGFQ